MQHYPLQDFVTHRFGLRQVDDAVKKSIEPDSMKVVIDPWTV
jgi:Zn-dependent alcohol dehydrogenase